jgi:potassium-dependent mechanosensitive channel
VGPLTVRPLILAAWLLVSSAGANDPVPFVDPVVGPELDRSSMPLAAAQLDEALREVHLRAVPPSSARWTLARLDAEELEFAAGAAEVTARMTAPGATVALRDARAAWSRRSSKLRIQRRDLLAYGATLDRDMAYIVAEHERWSAARASLGADASASAGSTADAALLALDTAREALAVENSICQDAVARIADLQRVATEVVDALDRAVTERIVTRDGGFLWAIPPAPATSAPVASIARDGLVERGRHLVGYASNAAIGISGHVIGLLVAAWLLLRARRVPVVASGAPDTATLQCVTRRPVSTAVVLALAVGLAVYARAPSAYLDVLVAVAAVPLARTLRVLLPRMSLGPLLLSFGVYGALRAVSVMGGAESAHRLGSAAVAMVAAAALVWAARALGHPEVQPGRPPIAILRAVIFGAMGAVVVALAGNIAGYVSLSTVLLEATAESLYVVIVLWVAIGALDGCARLVVRLPAAQRSGMVRNHAALMVAQVGRWTRWLGLAAGAAYVLFLFSMLDPLIRAARGVLGAELSVGAISLALSDVVVFVVAIWLAVATSRVLRFVLDEDVLPRISLPKGVPSTVSTLTHYVILIVGGMVALGAAGLRLDQFTFAAGALGIGIGFGLQAIANNLVSGLILLFERPIQVGDVIEVGSLTGTVQRIGMRASRVRTIDGAEVIVPNSKLISDQVVNWTLSDRTRRFEVRIGVAYGSRPEEVLAILEGVAMRTPGVLPTPPPAVYLDGFGDSSVDFVILAWAPYEGYLQVRSAARVGVEAALREANIAIPFPQRDVHVRSEGEGAPAIAPVAEAGGTSANGERGVDT